MTDTNHKPKAAQAGLDACDQEIIAAARQIGVAGACLFLGGVMALIATSGQTTWDIARSLYLTLVVLGPLGIMIARRFLRILMKHRRKELSIFNNQ
ncbi:MULTISPECIES: hypothetical protein [Roseobacteraceae]|uniref:Uncharacterized protein n=1 Tax=Pseudosulfitobacter pseudonitzschiae TaxID=1402135 RepID=A0A221K1N0_9RHOB|nr:MULTISPECIES: hypothetical protein [Roseobacteraceae]ASM72922.1 hypothetical protein SULPSESMR1_02121 [Pseudosulfitobacter pseudonitzschiae]